MHVNFTIFLTFSKEDFVCQLFVSIRVSTFNLINYSTPHLMISNGLGKKERIFPNAVSDIIK